MSFFILALGDCERIKFSERAQSISVHPSASHRLNQGQVVAVKLASDARLLFAPCAVGRKQAALAVESINLSPGGGGETLAEARARPESAV